jgi:hypothetical protein
MADKKISALTAASIPLAGTEVLPIVQSGATVKVAVSNLTAGRAISATELTLTTGNLIVASGQGIDFSATPNTGTSELLDDYEEGTWSPVYAMTGTNFAAITMSATNAKYTKVGNLVHVEAYIKTDNLDVTGATGFVKVTGLPFTTASSTLSNIVVSLVRNWAVSYPSAAYIGGSDTEIVLESRATANGATALMGAVNMTAGAAADQNTMVLTATYFAA